MSASGQTAELDCIHTAPGAAFISRQPVLDAQRRVTGYRVSYASSEPENTSDGEATRLFGDILSLVGLEELVGPALAHLPVSPSLLMTLGVPPVRPDQVVLRVAHGHALDPELRPILDALAGRGYALSLYDIPSADLDRELLALFGIVELDWSSWDERELNSAIVTIMEERATSLAVGLRSDVDFEHAKGLGFDLFAGAFYASPRMTEVRNVPVGSLSTLAAVARMQGPGANVEELEEVIDRDLGLSVKLLRYINSAYFGMRSKITSIRQAVMMLGARGVSRWAMMVALTGGTAAPQELSVMALTRARMCELLAAGRADVSPEAMFLIGLLSLADALLDCPLDRVLEELPLADEVEAALLDRAGPAGAILDAVTNYEIGVFDVESLRTFSASVGAAYFDALRWARETTQGLA